MDRKSVTLERLPSFSPMEVKILEAYLKICHRLGPDLVTLAAVAKEAGVAFGSVRYYFAGEGRLSLSEAAILYVLSCGYSYLTSSMQRVKKNKTPIDLVLAYLQCHFELIKKKPEHSSFLLYFYYLNATRRDLIVKNNDLFEIATERIQSLAAENIATGLWPRCDNLQTLAKEIHQIVFGACLSALIQGYAKEETSRAISSIQAVVERHRLPSAVIRRKAEKPLLEVFN